MKPVRLLLIFLGVFALLGLVAVALALTPAVQRWAVLRAAARQKGLQLQLESVAAGPASVALRGVRLQSHGVRVECDRLDADFSLWQLLIGSRLAMDRLQVTGLRVDASRLTRNRALAGVVAAPAALVQIHLPLELVVGELHVEGRAQLPGARGRPTVQADFKVTGGHFAPGREGALRLSARLVDPLPGARVGALDLQAGLQLKQSLVRTFDRIGLTALIDATGPQISGQDQLKVVAELARAISGENYLLHVDTLREGRSEDILVVNARQPNGAKGLTGDWVLTARSAQIEPFLIGGALPKFDARGIGTFALNAVARDLALKGSLQASASDLETLRPALRALGEVKLSSDFDVAADGQGIRLNTLAVAVAGEQPVLDLHAAGAVAFSLKERRFLLGGGSAGAKAATPADEIVRLKLTGLPLAWVRPFLSAADVSGGVVTGELALVSGEGGRLVVRTVEPLRAGAVTVVRAGRTLLAKADVTVDAEAELLPAGAQLRLRGLMLTTPAGDSIKAQATFTTPLAPAGPVTVAGEFTADLPALLAPWLPGAHLRLAGGGDGTVQPGRIELRRLNAEADDARGQRLGAVTLARPFNFDLTQWRADVGPIEVELARINVGRLPLGLLARLRAGLTVSGTSSPDEFVFSAQGDRLTLKARSPLLFTDVTVTRGPRLLLDRVTLEFSPVVDLSHGTISRVESGEVLMRDSSGTPLAKFTAELAQAAGAGRRGSLTFNVDLPTLVAQPLFARAEALSAGQASGELRAAALGGGAVQIEARATLNGLVVRDGGRTLPVANLGFRGLAQADGRFSIQAPILIDSAGQRSDLNLAVEGSREGGAVNFDARLTGEHVELGDAALLAAAAGEPLGTEEAGSNGAQGRALSPPAADELPFWSGWSGQLALDLKTVARGRDWTMSGLAGRLVVEPERIVLQKLAADFGGSSQVGAQGELAFAAGLNPYHLAGDVTLSEFDLGRFFRALEPDRAPTVEGICTVQGRLEGAGLTLDDTVDRTHGQFALSGRKGVFRGLKRASEKVSMASKAVQWSAALGSLLKTGKVKEAAEKVAGNGYFVDQLAQALAEFPYDQLSLKLVRDEALNLKINDVSLVSPDVRLVGSGQVTYEAGKSVLAQPLALTLNFSSRGRVEQILGKLRVLDGTRDELDYARAKEPVVLGGSLARPDPIPYYLGLLAAKAGD
jgi:hypothetical protein